MLQRPPPHTFTYALEFLEMARQIEDDTSTIILNPHDLHCASLAMMDSVWRADMLAYRVRLKYETDKGKRPASLL